MVPPKRIISMSANAVSPAPNARYRPRLWRSALGVVPAQGSGCMVAIAVTPGLGWLIADYPASRGPYTVGSVVAPGTSPAIARE